MKKNSQIENTVEFLLSLIFPNRCCFCSKLTEPKQYICDECKSVLPFIDGEICFDCGVQKEKCKCKHSTGHFYEKICAPLYYEDNVKTCIHNFKFRDEKLNYKVFGELMSKCCIERYGDIEFDYVAFVPMIKKDLRKRGYNQSGLLAKCIADSIGVPLADDLLIKIYETKNQHDCNYFERKGNLFGVFDVNPKYNVEGKNILIVDDIITSGITLSECAKMLRLYGAQHIYSIAAAIKYNDEKEEQK